MLSAFVVAAEDGTGRSADARRVNRCSRSGGIFYCFALGNELQW